MISFDVPPGFKTTPGFYKKDGGEGWPSELSAQIQIKKERIEGAQIIPFKFWDGSCFGKYSKPVTRFAIIVSKL